MTLSKRQQAVLIGIVKDLDHFSSLVPRYEHGNWALCREREAIENAKANIVATDPSKWLGEPMNPSLATMVSRCYAQLQDRGFVMRCARAWSDKYTTHLRLTPEGERVARELLSVERATLLESAPLPVGTLAGDGPGGPKSIPEAPTDG
ncbi:hypothetical protein [Lacipirellula sp.]|uniref:hypothetical protein n=1 Tax=Lacipirellula sp. TaxID=2691419 RepID=UPI003D0D1E62